MSEPEIRSSDNVEPAPESAAPPAVAPQPSEQEGIIDRALTLIERQPVPAALAIFVALTLLHLLILNLGGVVNGLYAGDSLFVEVGTNAVEILLLGFIAYNFVLPTLVGADCVRAYDDLRPSLLIDDRAFGDTRAGLVDGFAGWRIAFGGFWAIILTTVYGSLLGHALQGEGWGLAIQTIWLYVRLALTFGLLGSSLTYVAFLHHRFRAATGTQLRVDLFDLGPLHPISRYARRVAFYLTILLALAGPSISQPDAMYASAALLTLGALLTIGAVVGAMWGARRAIRSAKKAAMGELQIYARELWRRAYAGGRITEAVGIPALNAMLNVRNEIARVADWPGGFAVFARIATLAIIPILSWFGGQIATQILSALAP